MRIARLPLLLILGTAACLVSGQIRTGWDLTPPCKVVKDGVSDLTKINFVDNCDMWHAPHIANPFLLAFFTDSFLVAFFVSGLFEIFEALMVVIFKDFALFAGAANSLENLSDVLIDDWLIQVPSPSRRRRPRCSNADQAGLGSLLGIFYVWATRGPSLWGNWYTQRRNFLW